MALDYDRELFDSFRAKAITDPSQLERGKTYYSNTYPDKFTLFELSQDDLGWWMHDEGTGKWSCHDRNIGSSYNPWLLFENEEDAKACQ